MKDDLEPLAPDLLALLRQGTTPEAPGDDVRARLLARLPLDAPAPPGDPPPEPAPPASPPPAAPPLASPVGLVAAGAAGTGKVGLGAAMFLLGAVTGAGLHATLRPQPPAVSAPAVVTSVVTAALPAASPLVSATPEPPASGPASLSASSLVPVVPPPVSAGPTATASAPGAASSASGRDESLTAERAVLDMARSALARGQAQDALQAIERHRAEFPRPRLAEERESLAIQALVRAGRASEARTRFDRFRRSFPRSMMLPALGTMVGAPQEER